MSHDILTLKDLDDFFHRCACKRVSAVGCAVIPRLQGIFCHRFGHRKCPHRNSISDRFCHCEDIRLHTEALPCEHAAGPSHTALHLVADHEDIIFITDTADAFHKLPGRQIDTALALERLQDDSAGFIADQCLHTVQIV